MIEKIDLRRRREVMPDYFVNHSGIPVLNVQKYGYHQKSANRENHVIKQWDNRISATQKLLPNREQRPHSKRLDNAYHVAIKGNANDRNTPSESHFLSKTDKNRINQQIQTNTQHSQHSWSSIG